MYHALDVDKTENFQICMVHIMPSPVMPVGCTRPNRLIEFQE